MNAPITLWKNWQEQVKQVVAGVHGHQKKTLALVVMGVILSDSAVLQRIAESLYVHGINEAKIVSIERRLARFVANERVQVSKIWKPYLKQVLRYWKGKAVQLVPDCTLSADRGSAGSPLVKLCRDRKFHSLLRVCKEHTCRRWMAGCWTPWCAFQSIIRNEGQQWFGRILLWQDDQTIETWVSAVWDPGYKEAWLLISDQPAGRRRVHEYALRMRVESTFQDDKSRGWNLEHSLIEDLERLNRLLLAVFLAMWWVTYLAASCIHYGERHRFDRHDRRDKGFFRRRRLWVLDILPRARAAAALVCCLPFQQTLAGWCFALRF
jgi:hypothetical protein